MTSTANSNTFKSHSLYVQAIGVKLLSIRRQSVPSKSIVARPTSSR